MLFHWPSAVFAGLFWVGLSLVARYALGDLNLIALAIGVFVIASLIVGHYIARHVFFAIVPVIFSVGSLMLLFFIDSPSQRNIFIAISALLIYVTILGAYRLSRNVNDAIARGLIVAGATVAVFYFYATTFGVYLNFYMPRIVLAGIIFVVTTVIAWQYFVMIARGLLSQVTLYSVVVGAVMAQMAFVATYWPFGYLTTSVVLLMVYYILWDLAQSFFLDKLSKARVVTNIVFFIFLAAVVLGTSRWLPG